MGNPQSSETSPDLSGELAFLFLRDAVVFPGTERSFDLGRKRTLALLEALGSEVRTPVVVATQLVAEIEEPGLSDISPIGVVAHIVSLTQGSDGARTAILRGISRVRVDDFTRTEPYVRGRVTPIVESGVANPAVLAEVRELWGEFSEENEKIAAGIVEQIEGAHDAIVFANLISTHASATHDEQIRLLEAQDVNEQLALLAALLREKQAMTGLERQIKGRVKRQMDASQREYYLTEQLKAIRAELGQGKAEESDLVEIRSRLDRLALPQAVRDLVRKTHAQLERQSESAAEYAVGFKLLQHIAALPWTSYVKTPPDIAAVRATLDSLHFGADEVADWIVEELSVRNLTARSTTDRSAQTLCLVGPPGVGKTSLAQAIANSLDRPLQTISLAGAMDPSFIRGHRRTYIGSEPGMLTTALQAAGMLAPVILLDEIDKVSSDSYRGNVGAALLQALDPMLNRHYVDEYLGVTLDLSQVLFVATANNARAIYPPLRSRMRVLTFWGYSADEKLAIARDYILGRMLESHGLKGRVEIDEAALEQLIERYTQEAGVRELARHLERICRRCAVLLSVSGASQKTIHITTDTLDSLLGAPRVPPSMGVPTAQVGRVNAIAFDAGGARIVPIDSIRFRGRGKLVVSGSNDSVVTERMHVAMSLVRHRAQRLGFDPEGLHNSDVHVHIDASISTDDTPNLDLAICLSLISALIGTVAPQRSGVVGTVDLHGEVGGCHDFTVRMAAAQRQRLEEVIVPRSHEAEVARLPHRISNGLKFRFVASVDEAVDVLFGTSSRMSHPAE